MALTITDDEITSDEISAFALRRQPDHGWTVSTRDPERVFTRDQAITAMTIEEEQNRPEPNSLLLESLESELR